MSKSSPQLRVLWVLVAAVAIACGSQTPTPAPSMPSAPPTTPTPGPTRTLPPPTECCPTTQPPTTSPNVQPTPTVPATPTAPPTPLPSGPPTPPRTFTADTGIAAELGPQLQAVLDQQQQQGAIPGIGAAITFPDGSIWSSGSGNAIVDPAEQATGDVPFVVGSISKTFVTAVIMQLAGEGKLGLDDPLSNWMSDYPNAQNITIREMLHHTSGIFDYFDSAAYNTDVFHTMRDHLWTPQEILSLFGGPPYFAPGQGYHYSNTDFILLGLVIETITGQKLGDVYEQRLFGPLGLTETYFQGSGPPSSSAAYGYVVGANGPHAVYDTTGYRPTISIATAAWAAGGIDASAKDIAMWGDALYGGHVVDQQYLAQMEQWTYYPPPIDETYGLGTRSRVIQGERVFGHTGSIRGFDAAMWHFPQTDMTISVLTNLGHIDANPIADALMAVAYPAVQGAGVAGPVRRLTLASSSPAAAQTPLAASHAAQLQRVLDQQRALRNIPGATSAIIFPDGSVWTGGSGRAQVQPDERATPHTPFVVASITKTFITAAIMQLADEDKLAVDDPLSKWLPDYPRASQITLRELLNDTSGVFDYLRHPSFNRRVFKTGSGHYWTPQEILDTFAHAPYFAPGAGFRYSNTGFILLGMVIEQVTGMKVGDVLQQRFFTPLGLTDTYFQGNGPLPASAAQGYGIRSGAWNEWSDGTNYRPGVSGATVSWTAGAIASSALDLARWCAALYGGHVVSANALAQMEDYNYSPYTKGSYGLGTWTRVHTGERQFGHTGSFHGFDSAMWYYQDSGLVVVVLTNLANISVTPIADALAKVALGI